jgi:hypothetical protein
MEINRGNFADSKALLRDFRVQSASEFNDLQRNSLRKRTGNFGGLTGNFFQRTGNSHAKTENSTSDQFFDPTGFWNACSGELVFELGG